MARTQGRAHIPLDVRRDLWVAAGGRCEFKGCCKPADRDSLIKTKLNVGEFAHIIGDSPDGARGIPGESEALSKDPSNLMLLCFECHKRVDDKGKLNGYTKEQLRQMKREHEARIELVYSATGVKDTLPILMSFPIAGKVPVVAPADIRHAILENSRYTRFPTENLIHIDRSNFDFIDNSDEFWVHAGSAITSLYERRILPELTGNDAPSHLTIAAFAPIPLLMKLGALIGDKTEASVFDLPSERWLWDTNPDCPSPSFAFDVPASLPEEIAVLVSISNRAVPPPGTVQVEFRAVEPNRGIVRTAAHLYEFRRRFDEFLMALLRAGVRVVHIHPATPLSVSVEIGRQLLPKTFEAVHVREWRVSNWYPALQIK